MCKKLLKLWLPNYARVMNNICLLSLNVVVLAVLLFMVLMECQKRMKVKVIAATQHDLLTYLLTYWAINGDEGCISKYNVQTVVL